MESWRYKQYTRHRGVHTLRVVSGFSAKQKLHNNKCTAKLAAEAIL